MDQKLIQIIIFLGIISIAGCVQNEPDWVQELIQKEINEPAANPPASLSRCIYKGDIVYYIPPRCCDIPSTLYSEEGDVICSPDGGFTGFGDGKCADFFDEKKDCEVIWKDTR